MKREDIFYDSRDGKSKIHAVKWMPAQEKPAAILQIIHGMAEYVECYDEFAGYMTEKGFLVVGEDHLGHGQSVSDEKLYGYFCKDDPATVIVRDIHRLKKMVQNDYPGVPYIILGHSMGSFMLRNYLFRYGKGINGAIIVGTGNQPGPTAKFGKGFVRLLALFQGWKHKSGIINTFAFGTYNRKVENPRTIMDWLTKDTDRIDRYMEDPKCGFTFTLNGFYTLFDLIDRLNKPEDLAKIPKELPVLIAAGDMDPVGNYGAAIKEVYRIYQTLGMESVQMKLYEGDRHEIINEIDRKLVFEDIHEWIMSIID